MAGARHTKTISSTASLLADLTPCQREAVTHIDGPMLVIAGAGSGKTRVVTRRIAYLVSRGVWPSQILALTFTNKAANEMRERVVALTGEAVRWVGTFHATCSRFLRQDIERLGDGRTARFTIYDAADQEAVIKLCMKESGVNTAEDARLKPAVVRARISRAKSRNIAPEDFGHGYYDDEIIARVYAAYESRLRAVNALDFDDLLLLTVRLLETQPHVRELYHSRFRYLLVDEYQDTNHLQYLLTRLLTGPNRNVHVTGDPDQTIYSWRGAEYRNILDFTRDFPDARLVRLEQNYRSTKSILRVANELIRCNVERVEKELYTENETGGLVKVVQLQDGRAEALWVAERIADLRAHGRDLGEIAVFYRTNAQSRAFEEALMRMGLPYQVVGGTKFYERKEIKDLVAHLALLANSADTISLRRVVGCGATGVGAKTLARLETRGARLGEPVFGLLSRPDFADLYGARVSARLSAFCAWCRELAATALSPVAACVETVLQHSRLVEHYMARAESDPTAADRIENLKALVNRAAEFDALHPDAALHDFLADIALMTAVDDWQETGKRLSLMTLHCAKGLEFPVVFIVGLEDELLPHRNAESFEQTEEERRLLYVGMTRGREEVVLTHAAFRHVWGRSSPREPSPFLAELPADAVEVIDLVSPFSDDTW